MTAGRQASRLRKELGLFDVYAISTGAMFSSGFFLLPGLASGMTGPSVGLAYLVSALFILPAMLSVAELATAMPRAGGAYYFLDRSLGPMAGTVGGLGTWLALILKSAFALVGMGAYLAIYLDVPIKPLAVALTVAFAVLNTVGAKETSGLQRVLVSVLLLVLGLFLVQGVAEIGSRGFGVVVSERFTPFLTSGVAGFMGTVGFVFVSYAGLTKVASVAEEVRNPDRDIPLGMMLSLATAALVYSVGVFIIVAVVPPAELSRDLTPVATAAGAFFSWLPAGLGVALVVVAAIAAFASTGNAGILSASRYPLAMARDRLVSARFATLGRFHTPTLSIALTSGLIIGSILLLDVEGIAKLASAFQLLLFALLNVAVVIMRESGIASYDPGYRSPFYPWMQLFGFLAPFWLIAQMGEVAILFTLGLIAVTIGWYFHYAVPRVERSGAIFHTFARLGEQRHGGLDVELRAIVKEKGLRAEDPFDEVVARAAVLDIGTRIGHDELVKRAARIIVRQDTGVSVEAIEAALLEEDAALVPMARGVAIPHLRIVGLGRPSMLLARCADGIAGGDGLPEAVRGGITDLRALFFLVSPAEKPGQHLRLLGFLATQIDDPDFLSRWMAARGEAELKATLLREDRSLSVRVSVHLPSRAWAGHPLHAIGLPRGTLVALVRRNGRSLVPDGSSVLEFGDHLTIIGESEGIRALKERYLGTGPTAGRDVSSSEV